LPAANGAVLLTRPDQPVPLQDAYFDSGSMRLFSKTSRPRSDELVEGSAEGAFGLVTDVARDGSNALLAVAKQSACDLHPPAR
jgi:hypothetical protein